MNSSRGGQHSCVGNASRTADLPIVLSSGDRRVVSRSGAVRPSAAHCESVCVARDLISKQERKGSHHRRLQHLMRLELLNRNEPYSLTGRTNAEDQDCIIGQSPGLMRLEGGIGRYIL